MSSVIAVASIVIPGGGRELGHWGARDRPCIGGKAGAAGRGIRRSGGILNDDFKLLLKDTERVPWVALGQKLRLIYRFGGIGKFKRTTKQADKATRSFASH